MYATQELTATTCPRCGMLFAFPSKIISERKADRKSFYCPAGHSMWFPGKSDEERIKDLQLENQRKDNMLAEERGKVARMERRMKKGVCLYCKRTFGNVAAHMASKHNKMLAVEAR